ncbi:hypothetical protein D3C80_1496280 [compost metagenome]
MVLVIDLDETTLIEFDPGVFQAQVVQHRAPTCCVEHAIGVQLTAVLEGCLKPAVGQLVDADNLGIELQVKASLGQLILQVLTHGLVEPAQEQLAAIQQRGVGTQPLEDPGKFHRDVATAHHQYALGQILEEERLIGADGVLTPWNIRNLRPATGSDQDVPGTVLLAVDFD